MSELSDWMDPLVWADIEDSADFAGCSPEEWVRNALDTIDVNLHTPFKTKLDGQGQRVLDGYQSHLLYLVGDGIIGLPFEFRFIDGTPNAVAELALDGCIAQMSESLEEPEDVVWS